MREARRARVVRRVVVATCALVVAGAAVWGLLRVRGALLRDAGPALPGVPQAAAPVELIEVKAQPVVADPQQDEIEAKWCSEGPEAVVAATEALDVARAAESEPMMRHALLRAEALLALGRVEAALGLNRTLCEALSKPASVPAQACEALALEQHVRVRITAGETNLLKQEERLRACIDGRSLVGGQVPAEAWATLGTLQKARGECTAAVASYANAVAGLDAPAWLRLRQRAPWRMQVLALVALDRADCFATLGRMDEARSEASRLTADLATALGESDPLAQQAADLRDQLQSTP